MSNIKCPLMDKEVIGFKCANPSIEQQIRDSYFITLLKQAYGHQIMIDALSEYHEWYKTIGFKDFPGKKFNGITYPMFMDCMSKEEIEKLEGFCTNF